LAYAVRRSAARKIAQEAETAFKKAKKPRGRRGRRAVKERRHVGKSSTVGRKQNGTAVTRGKKAQKSVGRPAIDGGREMVRQKKLNTARSTFLSGGGKGERNQGKEGRETFGSRCKWWAWWGRGKGHQPERGKAATRGQPSASFPETGPREEREEGKALKNRRKERP